MKLARNSSGRPSHDRLIKGSHERDVPTTIVYLKIAPEGSVFLLMGRYIACFNNIVLCIELAVNLAYKL
jgi:hypothetical protein